MSRLASMVVPGLPHHVTQRGNRREAIFFEDGDQQLYCDMLGEQLRKFRVEVWAYCLMPNHVHLILTPQGADGMSRALGEAHRRYTNFIHARPMDRSFISEPVRVGRHGRVAPEVCGIVRQSESGSGPTCV
jgi:putative transposase